MDHRSHQCTAVRRKDHDHYDRRLAGNPGVLRGGSRDRRGRLSGKASLYYAAIAASGNYHQRGIKPDRRIEAVWNHPVYDFRWTWVSSHSLSTLINYLYFQNQNAGYSAAVGLCLFVIIMILGTVVRRFLEKKVEGLSL